MNNENKRKKSAYQMFISHLNTELFDGSSFHANNPIKIQNIIYWSIKLLSYQTGKHIFILLNERSFVYWEGWDIEKLMKSIMRKYTKSTNNT